MMRMRFRAGQKHDASLPPRLRGERAGTTEGGLSEPEQDGLPRDAAHHQSESLKSVGLDQNRAAE